MVLKSVIRYIIHKYLKDYIEQLDYEKLKLELKNGTISSVISMVLIAILFFFFSIKDMFVWKDFT